MVLNWARFLLLCTVEIFLLHLFFKIFQKTAMLTHYSSKNYATMAEIDCAIHVWILPFKFVGKSCWFFRFCFSRKIAKICSYVLCRKYFHENSQIFREMAKMKSATMEFSSISNINVPMVLRTKLQTVEMAKTKSVYYRDICIV